MHPVCSLCRADPPCRFLTRHPPLLHHPASCQYAVSACADGLAIDQTCMSKQVIEEEVTMKRTTINKDKIRVAYRENKRTSEQANKRHQE